MHNQAKDHHQGHRHRLRQRFMRDLGASMEDYEMLELLLMGALPRRDVKPVAKDLIQAFGDLAGVISAPRELMCNVKGIGTSVFVTLKLVQSASLRLLKQKTMKADIIASWQDLLSYCFASLAREKIERFHLLFLDHKNRLMRDEVQNKGTVNQTPVYTREVIKQALDIGATGIILVHNHPSGDPKPSNEDIEVTLSISKAGHAMGVTLHDHVIIGREGYVSFKSQGLL